MADDHSPYDSVGGAPPNTRKRRADEEEHYRREFAQRHPPPATPAPPPIFLREPTIKHESGTEEARLALSAIPKYQPHHEQHPPPVPQPPPGHSPHCEHNPHPEHRIRPGDHAHPQDRPQPQHDRPPQHRPRPAVHGAPNANDPRISGALPDTNPQRLQHIDAVSATLCSETVNTKMTEGATDAVLPLVPMSDIDRGVSILEHLDQLGINPGRRQYIVEHLRSRLLYQLRLWQTDILGAFNGASVPNNALLPPVAFPPSNPAHSRPTGFPATASAPAPSPVPLPNRATSQRQPAPSPPTRNAAPAASSDQRDDGRHGGKAHSAQNGQGGDAGNRNGEEQEEQDDGDTYQPTDRQQTLPPLEQDGAEAEVDSGLDYLNRVAKSLVQFNRRKQEGRQRDLVNSTWGHMSEKRKGKWRRRAQRAGTDLRPGRELLDKHELREHLSMTAPAAVKTESRSSPAPAPAAAAPSSDAIEHASRIRRPAPPSHARLTVTFPQMRAASKNFSWDQAYYVAYVARPYDGPHKTAVLILNTPRCQLKRPPVEDFTRACQDAFNEQRPGNFKDLEKTDKNTWLVKFNYSRPPKVSFDGFNIQPEYHLPVPPRTFISNLSAVDVSDARIAMFVANAFKNSSCLPVLKVQRAQTAINSNQGRSFLLKFAGGAPRVQRFYIPMTDEHGRQHMVCFLPRSPKAPCDLCGSLHGKDDCRRAKKVHLPNL